MSTEIHRERIDHPIAWSGSDFRDKDAIAFDLSTRQVAALEDIVMRTAALPRDEVSREHCGHIELDRALQGVYEEVIRGRGLVIVRGFPVDDHSIEENERIYWAFCTHFGPLMSHNSFGHRMVRVHEEVLPGGVQPARGTKSRAELAMHNDAADIFALLCVHRAEQGGESQFSSGPAAHNAILESRPDLLPILYRGFPHHRRSEQPDHQPAVTPYDVPIFSNVNQTLCINFTYSSILPALHELGREFTDQEVEAIDFLRAILVAQQLELELEPGEAVIVNNYGMCHSRSDFTNGVLPHGERRGSTWIRPGAGPRGADLAERLQRCFRRSSKLIQGGSSEAPSGYTRASGMSAAGVSRQTHEAPLREISWPSTSTSGSRSRAAAAAS